MSMLSSLCSFSSLSPPRESKLLAVARVLGSPAPAYFSHQCHLPPDCTPSPTPRNFPSQMPQHHSSLCLVWLELIFATQFFTHLPLHMSCWVWILICLVYGRYYVMASPVLSTQYLPQKCIKMCVCVCDSTQPVLKHCRWMGTSLTPRVAYFHF